MPKRVLIADSDKELTHMLARGCGELGLCAEKAENGLAALCSLSVAGEKVPDLLVFDIDAPIANGLTIHQHVIRQQEFAFIPIVLMANASDSAAIDRCISIGADYVLKDDDIWRNLKPLVCHLLDVNPHGTGGPGTEVSHEAPTHAPVPRVLCIDDDSVYAEVLRLRLKPRGIEVLRAFNGLQGFWMALKAKPNLIITDYVMPEGCGTYLVRRLKEHTLTKNIPVIVVTGRDITGRPAEQKDCALERQLLNLGADRVLMKPVETAGLLEHIHRCVGTTTQEASTVTPA